MLDIVQSQYDPFPYTQETQLFIGNVKIVDVLHVLDNLLQIHQPSTNSS